MLFLIFYTMLTMRNAFNHQIFDYAQSTRLLFVENNLLKEHAPWGQNFEDISGTLDLKNWLIGPFAQSAFINDGRKRYSQFVGSIRISQLRSKKVVCEEVPIAMQNQENPHYCYKKGKDSVFLESDEDVSSFGNFSTFGQFTFDGFNGDTGGHLEATVADDRERGGVLSQYLSAEMVNYPASAFAITIPPRVGLARGVEIIEEIFDGGYVDLQTKLVAVDLAFYNSLIDRVCTVRAVIEMDDAGLVTSSSDIKVIRAWRSHTKEDRHYQYLAILVLLFYIYYALQEVLEFHALGFTYWASPLNIFQVVNISLYFAYNMLYISLADYVPKDIDPYSDTYYNFQICGRLYAVASTLEGLTVVLNWFEAIPILSLSKVLHHTPHSARSYTLSSLLSPLLSSHTHPLPSSLLTSPRRLLWSWV
jgi:hypothetical protein